MLRAVVFDRSPLARRTNEVTASIKRSRNSQAFSMAAPLAVLSNTYHTSSAAAMPRTVTASVTMWFSSYSTSTSVVSVQPKIREPRPPRGNACCRRRWRISRYREIPYRSSSGATSRREPRRILGSHTRGPRYHTNCRKARPPRHRTQTTAATVQGIGPLFCAKSSVWARNAQSGSRVLQLQVMRNRSRHLFTANRKSGGVLSRHFAWVATARPIERRVDLSTAEAARVSL
jgi:hypothetical protein